MDDGLSHRVPGQPGNPHTIHGSFTVLEIVRISSYLVQHIGRVCSPLPSILSNNAHSIVITVFFFLFCYISRKCACVPSLPLFSSTHSLSTGLNSASVSLLHLTWEGLHRRTWYHTTMTLWPSFYWRVVSKSDSHVLSVLPVSSLIGWKRQREEVSARTAPPVPFPSPNQHTTLWPALL